MKCEQVRELLEDYRCNELPARETAAVADHLSACRECARATRALDAEEQLYAQYKSDLDRQLEVPPSMWGRVRRALDEREHSRDNWLGALFQYLPQSAVGRQALFAAALIVLSVGATLMAVRYYDDLRAGPGGILALGGTNERTLEAALQSIQRAEQDYLDAIRVLSDIVEKQKSTLDPRLVAELEANLKAIDKSIADTRRAYHEHPADAELAHYMLAAYSKKVELLQELAS
jgi:hypothetical protein